MTDYEHITVEQIEKIVRRAQKYDYENRPRQQNWSRVPDDQVIRLLLGAGFVKIRS